VEIAAFCDVAKERAEAFGKEYRAPAFSNIGDMMNTVGDQIDIVNILTPRGIHSRNVAELAPYRKPLVVEKPIDMGGISIKWI